MLHPHEKEPCAREGLWENKAVEWWWWSQSEEPKWHKGKRSTFKRADLMLDSASRIHDEASARSAGGWKRLSTNCRVLLSLPSLSLPPSALMLPQEFTASWFLFTRSLSFSLSPHFYTISLSSRAPLPSSPPLCPPWRCLLGLEAGWRLSLYHAGG